MIGDLENVIRRACDPCMGMPVTLSGGIDSSVLAAIIKPKFAINVELPGGDNYNESEYAQKVADHLGIKLHIVKLDQYNFSKDVKKAIKIIGEPCKHFNVFPLYIMFWYLKNVLEEDNLVIADGPDETMHGYARDLIYQYIMDIYKYDAFKPYKPLLDKIIDPIDLYAKLSELPKKAIEEKGPIDDSMINRVNMSYKRDEMDIMAVKFAEHFGIKIHKPYESEEVDSFMYRLPIEWKVNNVEYGKYALRLIADKYLPKEIAWRKVKRGGPVYPVNKEMDWMDKGEFDKVEWVKFQKEVLDEN